MDVEALGEAVKVGLPTVFRKFLVVLTSAFLAKLAAQKITW